MSRLSRSLKFLVLSALLVLVGCGGEGDESDPTSIDPTSADPTEVALETGTVSGTTVEADVAPTSIPLPTRVPPIATPTVTAILTGTAFTSQSKVSTAGIDEVIFGTEVNDAATAASTLWFGMPDGSWPTCFIVAPANGPDGVEFWVWSKLIERVEITNPGLRTRSGYGVGTQLAQLKQELGELITVEELDGGTQRATFTPSDPTDQYRLIFEIADGQVTRYSSGRVGIVDLGPGTCGAAPEGVNVPTGEVVSECEGTGLRTVSVEIPPLVQAMAEQIQQAAGDCDVDALEALTGPDFVASFGGSSFREVYGTNPGGFNGLARMLSYEPATDGAGNYVWPRAFVVGWDDVTPDMLEELRALGYGNDDFVVFESFGAFIGTRAGITPDGEWTFYVAGD